MNEIYVAVSRIEDHNIYCDVDSTIILFVYHYLSRNNQNQVILHLVVDRCHTSTNHVQIDLSGCKYLSSIPEHLPATIKTCLLPILFVRKSNCCVAGLCAVLRQLVKMLENDLWLLGFRYACLSTCAEFSSLTKFCEVDLLTSIKQCLKVRSVEIPVDVMRLEHHLSLPVRTHNIGKLRLIDNGIIQHSYIEGPNMHLVDLIAIPLLFMMFRTYGTDKISPLVPLVHSWFTQMTSDKRVANSLSIIRVPNVFDGDFILSAPMVKAESLTKVHPRSYKRSNEIFTKQDNVEHVIKLVEAEGVLQEYDYSDELMENFEWGKIPFHARPKGGNLPEERLCRKTQQIENIVEAVLKIAEDYDTIVDFCCGVGHVGIVLAYLLPKCRVILIDIKEHSLQRARDRVEKLDLKNVLIVQSNIDYFVENFQIGVTLHACGVATDLVMQTCILRRSKFVIAPCCYGKLQENHVLTYPRSKRYSYFLNVQDYLIAGHTADQTHKEKYSKSDQGEKCMKIVDIDRCIYAEESGYYVKVSKMKPITCSPKNNFIVGVFLPR